MLVTIGVKYSKTSQFGVNVMIFGVAIFGSKGTFLNIPSVQQY